MTEQVRRQRRKTLSDKQVEALKPKTKRYTVSDPEMRGHFLRISPQGPVTFVAVCRDQYRKQVWVTLGSADVLTIEQARTAARLAIGRVRAGLPAIEAPPVRPDAFRTVAEGWLKRRVAKEGFRTQGELTRCLVKYIYPHWASRVFANIKRSDVSSLLDYIVDNHGTRQADIVLAIIRAIGNWYATTTDDYASPVVRGMRRDTAKPRDRILKDDEIRAVIKAAEVSGTFGALIITLLLTAQRRGAVLAMRWGDVSADGVWNIRSEAREKSNAGALRLPPQALAIIQARPRLSSNPHIFAAARGDGPLNGLSQAKAPFDKRCGVKGWTLHDLRRTARSLMSRAGVPSGHAERTLGHVIRGAEGIYDQYPYDQEKADALARLAALIERIVAGPIDNVVALHPSASS